MPETNELTYATALMILDQATQSYTGDGKAHAAIVAAIEKLKVLVDKEEPSTPEGE